MVEVLALHGGSPVVIGPFAPYSSIGQEEVDAVHGVMKSGILSRYLGCWDEDFFGGEKVKDFEKAWANFFGVRHAVAMNSATSGLIASIGAIGISPGDEVIVSPYTMSASATAIVFYGGIPVFADVDPRTFNLNPLEVAEKITSRTRAIVVPNIFGQPAELNLLVELAKKHGLKIIEDNAQSPTAKHNGRYSGTLGDIGVFSLNYHKHIHTGEGGVCVTNDDDLAERLQLIRNHAESVVEDKGVTNLTNMVGFNFRMGEIEAAIGIEQLKKINRLVDSRVELANSITEELSGVDCLTLPFSANDNTHVYYIYPILFDFEKVGVSRDVFVNALKAEGVPALGSGYVRPLYLLPMYQKKIAIGDDGWPFNNFRIESIAQDYLMGLCPIAEDLHFKRLIAFEICVHSFTKEQIKQVGMAFRKVIANIERLK